MGLPVILVVDDEESVRLLLSTLLERYRYTVLLAQDGRHALEVSRNHPGGIDALVTDYKMPRLDGLQLAHILMAERPGIHVMMMSGRISKPEEMGSCGIPVLPKPFTVTSFMDKLNRCLGDPARYGA